MEKENKKKFNEINDEFLSIVKKHIEEDVHITLLISALCNTIYKCVFTMFEAMTIELNEKDKKDCLGIQQSAMHVIRLMADSC